jgi:hypothetical protein
MKKADNFNVSKWLIENKITTQSRLNENKIPGVDVDIDDDMITLSSDSGDYDGFIEDDGTVNFTVVNDEEEFDENNWKSILGDDHAFVKIANAIPTEVEALGDYVMITVKADDLKSKNNNVHESYYAALGGPSPLSDVAMKTKVVEPVLGPNFETVMMFKDSSSNPRYKQLEAKFPKEIIDKWKLLYRSDSYQGYAKLSPDGKIIKATILDDGGISGVFYVKSGD